MTDSEKLDLIIGELSGIKEKFGTLENKVDNLENKVGNLENKVDSISQEVSSINERVTNIELTLENETNKNIMVVAEGHLDLSRKLDNAINISSSVDSKMEIHKLYINKHESDINKLIRQIANGKKKIS